MAGTPLILSPVLGDDIPYSNQPSVEFEVPVVSGNSYPEEEMSQGNNQVNSLGASLLRGRGRARNPHMPVGGNMRQTRSNEVNEDMGVDDHFDSGLGVDDSVDSPGTLAHPSPILEKLELEDPVGGTSRSISEPMDTRGHGSDHLPPPAYWIRTGNSFMLIGGSREECEMIMGARGVECRFLQYSGR